MSGQAFAAFVFVVAAAEAAIGLAIVIAIYRNRRSTVVEDVNLLKG
jgi:NADH:ubiquinone oxidoreductase subunit K